VAAYPQLMPSRALALPDEAPDLTTTEVRVLLPDGREILDGGDELARAGRLADKRRDLGSDPAAL
jgi:hypothetical protein